MPRQDPIREPLGHNGDLAKFIAEFADALNEYPDLPAVAAVTIGQRGVPQLSLATHTSNVPLAHATWGDFLGHPVVVDTRERKVFGLDRVRTRVMLRGIECVFEDPISGEETLLCLSAIGVTPRQGQQYTILAADLLRVLQPAEVGA